MPEKCIFPFSVQPTQRSGLISIGSTDGRPAKHLYGLNRAGRSPALKAEPQPAFQGRDQTPRPGPETLCSSPIRYPFKSKSVAHLGSSFLQTCGWGGIAQFIFVCWLWLRVKRADGESEPLARAVGGRITRSVAAGDRAQSNRRSPAVPNTGRRCSSTMEFCR